MEIRQFRVVIRARNFEATCRFYGEVLTLSRLQNWDREDGRGALYQAGSGVIEILGRSHDNSGAGRDETFDYQGPKHKLTLTFVVPNAQKAYEDMHFRDPSIRGGLRKDPDGTLVFETRDPDGVNLIFRQG
jgi:catechol 2,3-dioxygenase-like lactoylglutathione lyase family enzyme